MLIELRPDHALPAEFVADPCVSRLRLGTCRICDVEFSMKPGWPAFYCGDVCRREARRRRTRASAAPIVQHASCHVCGASFVRKYRINGRKYCSSPCKALDYRKKPKIGHSVSSEVLATPWAAEVLAKVDELMPERPVVSAGVILLRAFSNATGIAGSEIIGRNRRHPVIAVRFLAIFGFRKSLGWSLARIARFFDNRDHSSIAHALKKCRIAGLSLHKAEQGGEAFAPLETRRTVLRAKASGRTVVGSVSV